MDKDLILETTKLYSLFNLAVNQLLMLLL